MKKRWMAALCALLVAVAAMAAAEAFVPAPTPKPLPQLDCDVPAYEDITKGVDARTWATRFLLYCQKNDIPVEERGFKRIGEYPPYGERYRLMAGGAELDIQVRDNILVNFGLDLDCEAMTTQHMEETLLFYFPQVMRACVYASTESGMAAQENAVVDALCAELETAYGLRAKIRNQIQWQGVTYSLSATPMRFWHTVYFDGTWEGTK